MRVIDRFINFIFSLAMIIISAVILLVIFNFVESDYINSLLNQYVWNADLKMIVGIVSGIVFLAGLKTTIFLSDFKKKKKIPIMVGTTNGNIQIASETIENTAKAVASTHEEVKEVNVKMLNRPKGVEVFMSLLVVQDTNIRELTQQIQQEVKEKIHDTTGVLVLNTDIKIKNIVDKNVADKNKKVVAVPVVEAPKKEEIAVEEALPAEEVTEEIAVEENHSEEGEHNE